jgi:outer membrane lipoprotein carrier protein
MSSIKTTIIVIILALLTFTTYSFSEDPNSAILDKIEKVYSKYNDMKAEFAQESYNATSETTKKLTGLYFAKRPNLMKWEYNEPDEQYFVVDGSFLWFYTVEDKQVVKSKIKEAEDSLKMFLDTFTSIKKLENDFTIKIDKTTEALILQLKPKKNNTGLASLNIYMNPTTYELLKTENIDHFYNRNTITFKKIETNTGLKDDKFKFEIPKGVEVIEN